MWPLPVPVIDFTPRIPPNDCRLGKAEFHGKDFITLLLHDRLDQTYIRTTPLYDPTRAGGRSHAAMSGVWMTVSLLAFVIQCLGQTAERRFFFAEANHPQNLYDQSIAQVRMFVMDQKSPALNSISLHFAALKNTALTGVQIRQFFKNCHTIGEDTSCRW
jgi:hypothetical protein